LIMSSNDIGARVCQLRDDEDVLSTVQTTIWAHPQTHWSSSAMETSS
jgi:hypothetical protein